VRLAYIRTFPVVVLLLSIMLLPALALADSGGDPPPGSPPPGTPPPGTEPTTADQRCFPETGYCITGRFRQYWEQQGGVAAFGYPVSSLEEINPITGERRLTQWFQKTRFEFYPENPQPYDVLLGRVGVELLNAYGRDWWSLPQGRPQDGCMYFEETRHTLCAIFMTYWQSQGLELDGQPGVSYEESVALFGKPISEPRWELHGGENASVRITQWFERARFEWNPDLAQVVVGPLGSELRAVLPPPPPPSGPPPAVTTPTPDVNAFDLNEDGAVTCEDFASQAEAQIALDAGFTNLDEDGNGIPCEDLPEE